MIDGAGAADDPAALAAAVPGALGPFFRLIRAAVRVDLPTPGLPTAEVDLLRVVERHPGITVAAAAERLRLAPNTVSTRVTHLVGAGLLDRRPGEADRRQATLHLTAETEARFAAWAEHRSAVLDDLVARLTPEERTAITAALPALGHLRRLLEERAGTGPAR
ncbi:MarR family winged helix-turn-helix transcriptional regulator [Pseudonocardia lutea]|jgi:DNA-binding MarR family transcriptional regulator|uniref:MarR family winged helix-turn-helix transcriptional regulator n=1 Tax=Pseudonocardia lutea TaxID=2172015 RepID=A0ABW1ICL9_9PSEU